MKRLKTSDIGNSTALPIKSGTLEFIQDAYKETIANLITGLIPVSATDTIYIISGCINTGTGANYIISSGVVYVNDEVYNVDAVTFTLTGLQKAYARIAITQFITNADPVAFTDGVTRNVHNIRKIVIENTTASSSLPEYKDFIKIGAWLKGDVKQVDVSTAYIAVNFDETGLGRLERLGWAICNGANNTFDRARRTAVGYDPTTFVSGNNFTQLRNVFGAENHTLTEAQLPAISRDLKVPLSSLPSGNTGITYAGNTPVLVTVDTISFGSGQTHNNMQPSIVTLFIQKI